MAPEMDDGFMIKGFLIIATLLASISFLMGVDHGLDEKASKEDRARIMADDEGYLTQLTKAK